MLNKIKTSAYSVKFYKRQFCPQSFGRFSKKIKPASFICRLFCAVLQVYLQRAFLYLSDISAQFAKFQIFFMYSARKFWYFK